MMSDVVYIFVDEDMMTKDREINHYEK